MNIQTLGSLLTGGFFFGCARGHSRCWCGGSNKGGFGMPRFVHDRFDRRPRPQSKGLPIVLPRASEKGTIRGRAMFPYNRARTHRLTR